MPVISNLNPSIHSSIHSSAGNGNFTGIQDFPCTCESNKILDNDFSQCNYYAWQNSDVIPKAVGSCCMDCPQDTAGPGCKAPYKPYVSLAHMLHRFEFVL